ncbi:hypothetical protein, partial [Citrobacter portucalensis]|uniref:hypothetical protein n=1 Tax=Citrobacter portucalensis TaxID=1639133 RepID=UPI00397AFDA2
RPDKALAPPSGKDTPDALRLSGLRVQTYVGQIRRLRRHPAKKCLMRCAYQAYEYKTYVGRIRRLRRHPAKIRLMRFAYQAYEYKPM